MMSPTSLSSRSVSLAPLRLAGVVLLALLPGASAAADGLGDVYVGRRDGGAAALEAGQVW